MAEKIKMSSIREKFPMYGDIPDEQLLKAVREKFYPEIPMPQFVSRVDWDTQRERDRALYDPTKGQSGFENFVAGYGKAGADLARGAGQWLGLVSRDDVAESRKLDQALANTTGGKVGNIAGNVAAMLPLAMLPGANTYAGAAGYGALTGAVAPSESTEETTKNIGLGGGLGAGSIAAGRAIGAGAKMLQGLVEPLTKKGQERVAASTLQLFAKDPTLAAAQMQAAKPLVPGSNPTMAQATTDPGLAQLERTLVSNPETGPQLAARFADQRAARLGAIGQLAGDSSQREAAVAAREAATQSLYRQATNAAYQVDDQLSSIMKRPIMQQAMNRAQKLAENQGRPPVQFSTETSRAFAGVGGAPVETQRHVTGQGLQDLKMALDDLLSDPMAGIGKNEANAVKATRAQLLDWMEKANPAFRDARTTFSGMSKPINTMDVASALMDKMQPALARYGANTRETANAYAQALEAAKETVKKQTGINKPIDEVLDKSAVDILNNIAKDMGRKAAAEEAGKAVGSNTAQNLSAQNLLRRTLGPSGLPQSWAESTALQTMLSPLTGIYKLGGADQRIMDRIAQAALDPNDAAALLMLSQKPGLMGLVGQRAEPFIPLLPRAGLFAQPQQQ